MSTTVIALIIIVSCLSLAIIGLTIFSHVKYQRSLMATIVEWYLKLTSRELNDNELIDGIKDLPKKNDCDYQIPKLVKMKVSTRTETLFDIQTFFLNEQENCDKAIIYLHGGGYVRPPRLHHWKFLNRLAKKSNLTTIVPIYPKAPNHCCSEVYSAMTELYLKLEEKYNEIILMGDSSGGGLALGLCERFLKNNISQPNKLILLSPWVDISLTNSEIPAYQNIDPFISAKNERLWGKCWAKELDISDYKVSPINGELTGLKDVYIFAGTREILFPDCELLHKKMLENGVKSVLIVGKNLNHVYPIYPIPEAKTSLKQILEILEKDHE